MRRLGTRRAHGKRILNPFWAQKGRAQASLGIFLQNIFNQGFVFAPIFAYCIAFPHRTLDFFLRKRYHKTGIREKFDWCAELKAT